MITEQQRDVWATYTATWQAPSRDTRLRAFEDSLAEGCVYTDPNIRAVGHAEIADYMDGFQQQLPGGGFATRQISGHHDSVLVEWDMVDSSGAAISPGTSIGTFNADGRLTSMTGFFSTEE